jgi:hypothetical protein
MTGVVAAAAGPPAVDRTVAPARAAAMLALARVEGLRLLRHPATVVALVLLLAGWTRWMVTGANRFPVLHDEDRGVQYAVLVLLGGAALIGSNLAVLRAHRHGTTDMYGVLVLPRAWRLGGHLLAIVPLVVLTGILVTARTGLLMLPAGAVGRPNAFELAASPLAVAFMGAVGVLLGRLIRTTIVAPVAVLFVAVLTVAAAVRGPSARIPWFLPVALVDASMPVPSQLLGRPAGAHLAYLAGLVGLVAVAAVGRRTRLSAMVVAVALVAVAAGGVVQSRPLDAATTAARVVATDRPAPMQACELRRQVTYCAFPEFAPWIDDWDRVVRAVLARVPPAVAGQPHAVRQRVVATESPVDRSSFFGKPAASETWGQDDTESFLDAQERADAAAGTPHAVTVGTQWGSARDEVTLAAFVAHRVLGGDDRSTCGSRSVLTAWLAAQASPHAAAGLREIDDTSWGAVIFAAPNLMHMLMIDDRDLAVAKELLRRPAGDVAGTLAGAWDGMVAADAPTERIAELFGVPVGPRVPGLRATPCDR